MSNVVNALIRNFIYHLFTDKKSKRVSAATRYKVEKKVGNFFIVFFSLCLQNKVKLNVVEH